METYPLRVICYPIPRPLLEPPHPAVYALVMTMQRTVGCVAGFALALAVLGAAGCELWQFKGDRAVEEVEQVNPHAWPFVPVAMRVHPFTAIESDEENHAVVLEARVELLDRAGDMTKGVGRFRFELYRTPGRASSDPVQDERLYAWDVPMATLDENARHYDAITRTYAFKLKMDRLPPPGTPLRLLVQFDNAHGPRLGAEAELTINPVDEDET